MKYFVRWQFGNSDYQPKKGNCMEVEAKNKPDAYKQVRLSLPKHIIDNNDFHFVDCVKLKS